MGIDQNKINITTPVSGPATSNVVNANASSTKKKSSNFESTSATANFGERTSKAIGQTNNNLNASQAVAAARPINPFFFPYPQSQFSPIQAPSVPANTGKKVAQTGGGNDDGGGWGGGGARPETNIDGDSGKAIPPSKNDKDRKDGDVGPFRAKPREETERETKPSIPEIQNKGGDASPKSTAFLNIEFDEEDSLRGVS